VETNTEKRNKKVKVKTVMHYKVSLKKRARLQQKSFGDTLNQTMFNYFYKE